MPRYARPFSPLLVIMFIGILSIITFFAYKETVFGHVGHKKTVNNDIEIKPEKTFNYENIKGSKIKKKINHNSTYYFIIEHNNHLKYIKTKKWIYNCYKRNEIIGNLN